MRRSIKIGATCSLFGMSALWFYLYDHAASAQPDNDYSSWSPSATTIRDSLKAVQPAPGRTLDQERRQTFAHLFQSRFRGHTPMMAVGVRFVDANRIKLMCEARMEPWNINKTAMSLWQEANQTFGQTFSVDIFETFIGSMPIKIGELRPLPDKPTVAHIAYDYVSSEKKLQENYQKAAFSRRRPAPQKTNPQKQ